jgi:hypothetical protein
VVLTAAFLWWCSGASSPRERARVLEMAVKSSKEFEADLELAGPRLLVGLRKKVLSTPDRRSDPSESISHAERTTANS